VYKRSDGSVYEPPPGISTFTVKDLILHVLASIQAIKGYHYQKDGKDRVIEAKVLLIGTHSDHVSDVSVRNRIESDVQMLLKDTPYYQKGMLQVPCRKQQNERFVYGSQQRGVVCGVYSSRYYPGMVRVSLEIKNSLPFYGVTGHPLVNTMVTEYKCPVVHTSLMAEQL